MPDKGKKKDLLLPDNTGVETAKRALAERDPIERDPAERDPEHNNGGRFVPGMSGNPAGRPRGSRNKAAALLAGRLDQEWQAVADCLVAAAKAGNAAAANAVLDRVAPRPRGRSIVLDLPRIVTLEDVDAAVDTVLDAVAAGQVTPQEAATVSGIIETKRRVIESRALDGRVRALEDQLTGEPLH